MIQNIPFFHSVQRSGDIVLAPSDKYYWVNSVLRSTLVYWHVLPDNPFAIDGSFNVYKTKNIVKKLNFPRIGIENLNRNLGKATSNELWKELINNALDIEETFEKVSLEDKDNVFCGICGKDLI